MTADDLAIFQRHTGRVSPPLGGSKETYLIIGRRGGKSFISALVTCFIACFIDFSPFITVGETLAVMCLAKDKDQARIVFRYVKAILNHIPALKGMIVEENDLSFLELADELELPSIDDAYFRDPNEFASASEDEQGRLDQKKPVECPECGHQFIP